VEFNERPDGAHRLSTIQRMDKIVVMEGGRVKQVGTHDELIKDEQGVYAKLWAHQSGGYLGAQSSGKGEGEEL
jgi:ATP-binding cassette subfamily B multidrug efflux pump